MEIGDTDLPRWQLNALAEFRNLTRPRAKSMQQQIYHTMVCTTNTTYRNYKLWCMLHLLTRFRLEDFQQYKILLRSSTKFF